MVLDCEQVYGILLKAAGPPECGRTTPGGPCTPDLPRSQCSSFLSPSMLLNDDPRKCAHVTPAGDGLD